MVQAVTGKIEADVLNGNFSELDSKLASVNAGPGGRFNSEAELKAAYPNGSDRFFVVSGYMYWWKNGVWTKGDPFVPPEISEGSVGTLELANDAVRRSNTTFYNKAPGNLIDIDNCRHGGYFSGINGRWSLDPTLKSTEFIEVKAGDRMVRDFFTHLAFFDISNNFISGIVDATVRTFIVPAGVSRLTAAMNENGLHDTGVIKVVEAEFYQTPNKGTVRYTDEKQVLIPQNIGNEQLVKKENAIFVEQLPTANVFNMDDPDIQRNLVLNLSGAWTAMAGWITSGYVPVKSGDILRKQGEGSVYLFTEPKGFIETKAGIGTTFTVPENTAVKFARFAVQTTDLSGVMITKNNPMPSSYIPYRKFKLDNSILLDPSSIDGAPPITTKKDIQGIGDSLSTVFYATNPYWKVINLISTTMLISMNAMSGSRIAKRDDRSDSLIERRHLLPAGKDVAFVWMGSNDAADNTPIGEIDDGLETTLKGAMSMTIEEWKTTHPKTRIGFILPLRRGNVSNVKMRQYLDAMIEVLEAKGVPYLDLMKEGGLDPYNASVKTELITDGIHPNNDGHLYLVPRIIQFLESL